MELYPKYIVEDGCLILSKVRFHSDLVTNRENVVGGGWFLFDQKLNTITLHGSSHDYGAVTLADVKKCVEAGNVFSDKYKHRNIAGKHLFAYNTGTEIIPLQINK